MLMLLGIALPFAVLGFSVLGDDDDDAGVTENGTPEADRIEGTLGNDFLDGEAGDDLLNGRAGDDTIFGRDGNDVLQGQDGADMLCSGDGEDIVTGNRGFDLIEGQGGDDWVSGDYGSDTVRGDEGNDTVLGGRGTDAVEGGDGDDLLFGGIIDGIPLNLEEMDAVRNGASIADLNGGIDIRDDRFGNAVLGGAGNDDMVIGSMDTVEGGFGQDTFHLMSEQTDDPAATINDFNANHDAITVIVDDTSIDADITVEAVGEDAIIRFGDTILATVNNAAGTLSAADITLIAESTVESLFDPNGAAA